MKYRSLRLSSGRRLIALSFLLFTPASLWTAYGQIPLTSRERIVQTVGKGGEFRFSLTLKDSEVAFISVWERIADVAVTVQTTEGTVLQSMNFEHGFGQEAFTFIPPKAGDYYIVCDAKPINAEAKFELTATVKPISDTEKKRAEGEKLLFDGYTSFLKADLPGIQAAVGKWQQAIQVFTAIGDNFGLAQSSSNLAFIMSMAGQRDQALLLRNKALKLYESLGDVRSQTQELNNLGTTYLKLGDRVRACEYLEKSLPLSRSSGSLDHEANIINNLADLYYEAGDLKTPLGLYERALEISLAINDDKIQMTALVGLASINQTQGDFIKARETLARSLIIAQRANDKAGIAAIYINLGALQSDMSVFDEAILTFKQAYRIAESVGDQTAQVKSLLGQLVPYITKGQFAEAKELAEKALSRAGEIKSPTLQSQALAQLAFIHTGFGEYAKVLDYIQKSLGISRQLSDRIGEANAYYLISDIYSRLGDYSKALDATDQSLALYSAIGYRQGQARTLRQKGTIASARKEYDKALVYLQGTLEGDRSANSKREDVITLTEMSALGISTEDLSGASKYALQALLLAEATGDSSRLKADVLTNYSQALRRHGEDALAVFYAKWAANTNQDLRLQMSRLDRETQKSYLKRAESTYKNLALMLAIDNRLVEAHQVLTEFKDQVFFDLDGGRQPSRLTATQTETDLFKDFDMKGKKLQAAQERVDALNRRLGNSEPTGDEKAERVRLAKELQDANTAYLELIDATKREFGTKAKKMNSVDTSSDLSSLQSILRTAAGSTRQEVVAIYPIFGNQANYMALIVTSRGIKKVSYPIIGSELNEKIRTFSGLLQSPNLDPNKIGKEIYDIVFKPIEAALPLGTKTIMWSLDGNLRYVPMGALFDGKRYLAERYNHVVFTRADKERMMRAVSPVWTGSGFGSSQSVTVDVMGAKIPFVALPGVAEELAAVFKNPKGGVIDGAVLPDKEFTRAGFISAMKQKRPLVHIASHFSFRPGDESRSFLLMGDGTAFTLDEMKREVGMFEGVELLTLSACNTAAEQADANGREIDGFAELAQRLGAGAVMATLWPVSDASTPWLMREFYTRRQAKAGTTKAQALRDAQMALLNGTAKTKPLPEAQKGAQPGVEIVVTKDGKSDGRKSARGVEVFVAEKDAPLFKKDPKRPFAHPYYWAPFVLIGNWRRVATSYWTRIPSVKKAP